MTEPSELRGAITKEEAGEVAVVLSDEIYRLSSAAQMGYEQSDAEFFAPRAERLDLRAEYLRSIRSKLLAPSVPEPPHDAKGGEPEAIFCDHSRWRETEAIIDDARNRILDNCIDGVPARVSISLLNDLLEILNRAPVPQEGEGGQDE